MVLVPERPAVAFSHPLGCHRPRVPDRVVFDHVIAALVHGSGYERIATDRCSDRTIRRRLWEWAEAGLMQALHTIVLIQYDRMIGLELDDVAVDGCITKAPGGGEVAGRSPVDRVKQGLKRSVLVEATGVPLHWSPAAPTATTVRSSRRPWPAWQRATPIPERPRCIWIAGTTTG